MSPIRTTEWRRVLAPGVLLLGLAVLLLGLAAYWLRQVPRPVQPPAGSPPRVRAATPSRQPEAALHLAAGEEAFRQGRYPDSAAAFEQVLLLEPDNIDARYGRTRAWFHAMDYPRAIESAQQALSRPLPPDSRRSKGALESWLAQSYWQQGQYQEYLEFCRKIVAEDPKGKRANSYRIGIAASLLALNRHDEGVALLKGALAEAGDDRQLEAQVLKNGFVRLFAYVQMSPTSKDDAKLAITIIDRILDSAEEHPSSEWSSWARNIVHAVDITYRDERRAIQSLLTPEEKVFYCRRILKVFPDLPDLRWMVHDKLAENLETLGDWKEARESYRYVGEHSDDAPRESIPYISEVVYAGRNDWLTKTIKGRLRAAIMLNDHLDDTPGACTEYLSIVRDFGIAHPQGMALIHSLANNRLNCEFPKKGALIVGGGADAWQAWQDILTPMGYTVHPFDLDVVSGANLGFYSLVVLVRQGQVALTPSEVLAFRSYVATGGTLLAVVSPGWRHAQPSILNPVLSFFEVHAQSRSQGLPLRAQSTALAPHPITRGITSFVAKDAVGLDVPAGVSIARAGDKTLLAALDYYEGRVVVAALGQWFLPSIAHLGNWASRCPLLREGLTPDQLPIESGEGLEIPLLRNVIAWLGEPIAGHPEGRRLPADLRKMHGATIEVLYQLRDRNELPKVLDTFLDALRSGPRREEGLWVAGEATKALQWFNRLQQINYGWPTEGGPLTLDPRYFDELVQSFPKSDLAAYARWEQVEFPRINRIFGPALGPGSSASDLISAFEKVDAPKGSYAWAWAQVRLAMLNLLEDHPKKSLEHARAVADVMEDGPEKVLALFYGAACAERLGREDERARYFQRVVEAPDLLFLGSREDAAWGPLWLDDGKGLFLNTRQPTRNLARLLSQRRLRTAP